VHLKRIVIARPGTKQKKIDINIPKVSDFIHRVYIETYRNIYRNVYLYEQGVSSLQQQKNRQELKNLVQDSIMTVIRNSIPIDSILHAYMAESIESDTTEEITEEIIQSPKPETLSAPGLAPAVHIDEPNNNTTAADTTTTSSVLSFDPIDHSINISGHQEDIHVSKDPDFLETISSERHAQRKMDELAYDTLNIGDADNSIPISLGESLSMNDIVFDIQQLDPAAGNLNNNNTHLDDDSIDSAAVLGGIEIL
jgi:hypothetical protein